MRATMRLPARTLLVLVLCLAALVGASAQASYFSSFFSGEGAGSGEDWEDGEDALADATRQEKEDASVDAKLRALMADAASFGADADGIRDAHFEAEEDAFLEDALVDEDGGVELPVAPPAPPPLEIPREASSDDARVEESRVEDAVGSQEAREAKEDDEADADDDAAVFARMAALEAELLGLASEDDIEEEWLPAGGDGEEAPRVRAPRTLLTPRDDQDEERGTRNVQNEDALLNANANANRITRRALLTSSVSGDNTRWVAFEDMPARLGDSRSGPEARVARDHGEAHVTRAGGYWQAARFNRVERPSRSRLPKNFGAGAGEGTLEGPRGGDQPARSRGDQQSQRLAKRFERREGVHGEVPWGAHARHLAKSATVRYARHELLARRARRVVRVPTQSASLEAVVFDGRRLAVVRRYERSHHRAARFQDRGRDILRDGVRCR
jgi:hypothetical protein